MASSRRSREGSSRNAQKVFLYLIFELALFLLSAGINQARRLIQQLIQLQLANRIRGEIIHKALTLDLSFFEHPDFYDRLQNARREGGYKPVDLINDTFQIVQNSITLISFAVLLLRFSPWLVVILLVDQYSRFHRRDALLGTGISLAYPARAGIAADQLSLALADRR